MAEELAPKKFVAFHYQKDAQKPNSLVFMESEKDDISIGQRLRHRRGMRGLSLKVRAVGSGLNINTLSLIENEHTSPSVSILQQLAQILQISITEYFQTDRGNKKLVHQKQGQRPQVTFKHSIMEDLACGMPRFGWSLSSLHLSRRPTVGRNPSSIRGENLSTAWMDDPLYCGHGEISSRIG
jgi:transcriptional regulator with XRE-family HTH domain